MTQDRDPRPDYGGWRVAAGLSTVGLTLALSVAIGVGIGWLLDQWLHTRWLVIVFTIVGVMAGFKQLIQALIRFGREQDASDAARRNQKDETGDG
jgi:ATP synthase protein I